MTNPARLESPDRLTRAIVRLPGENFGQGLTTAGLGAPDFRTMLGQHAAYVRALENLGLEVLTLEPQSLFPDAHFVEDTAVVLPELAVIARPGAPSRRGEEETIEPVLRRFRPVARIREPGTLDGGDVLVAGRRIFCGLSARTNEEGARQLGALVMDRGYSLTTVPVASGLHLKSGVSHLGGERLLLTRGMAGCGLFRSFENIEVDPSEEFAANALFCNGSLVVPAGAARTRRKLEKLGMPLVVLDVSEARKMDGGLTCLSIRF
ncbi:MAG: amidinotransferase [Candidatus Aminicenantes bacterium]|nr:amidinotransferase [Candidatus Aminicenantes bacterium]